MNTKLGSENMGLREIILTSVITVGFFVGLVTYSHIKMRQTEKSAKWVTHTLKVINKLQEIETDVFKMINSRRGYFITHKERFLNDFEKSIPELNAAITELERLVSDNAEQAGKSEELRAAVNDLALYYQGNIGIFDVNQLKEVGKGQDKIDQLTLKIVTLKKQEEEFLSRRLEDSEDVHSMANMIFIFSSVVGISIIFFGILIIAKQFRKKNQIQRELFLNSAIQNVMLQHAPYALIAGDVDGKITLFNKAASELLGYAPEEVIGKSAAIFHLPEEMALWAEALSARFNEKIPVGSEVFFARPKRGIIETDTWTYVRKDGTQLPVKLTVSALRNEQDEITGFMGLSYDISKQLEFEEAIMKAKEDALAGTRAKSEFLANMSHEIRTPMNAIMGMAELLNETEMDDEQKKYVEIFQRAGESLLTIINDILDLSKIEARHFELDKISFQLSSVVEKASEIMAIKSYQKGIELAVDIDHEVFDSYIGDPNRIRQVLLNLIGNAVKFTQHGEILVTVKQGVHSDGVQDIVIQVQDSGIGMSEEQLKRIFERFTQGDSSITREFGGTGLGLNISRRLVELMNGTIKVESTLGVGTKVTVYIRLEKDEIHKPQKKYLELKGKKILIVDDTRTNRIIFRKILEQQQGLVYEAQNGAEALKIVESHAKDGDPFTLLIIDCRMPVMDGFTLAETIHRSPILKGPLMMMLTSDSRPGDMMKARSMGIDSYLVKPILRHDLLEAIEGILFKTLSKGDIVVPAPPVISALKNGLRILLVDDNAENRLVITSFFRTLPWTIDEAKNGREAFAFFKQKTYDLILMDMQMPIMDGYTVTREIRRSEDEENLVPTPILALTAYALKEEVTKSLLAGCNGHLTKPVGKKSLIDTIENYTRPVTLEMEKELMDMFPEYLINRSKELLQIKRSLEVNDFNSIEVFAHKLKGSAGSFGLDELSIIGGRLEEQASYGKKDQIMDSLVDYEFKLGQIRRAMRVTGAKAL